MSNSLTLIEAIIGPDPIVAIAVETTAPGAVKISLTVPSTGDLTDLVVPSKFFKVAIMSPSLTTVPGSIFKAVTVHCFVPTLVVGVTILKRSIPFLVVKVALLLTSMS